jgi:hypothetical protein
MAEQRIQSRENKVGAGIDSNVNHHPNNNIDSKTNVYEIVEDRNVITRPPIGIRTPGRGPTAKLGARIMLVFDFLALLFTLISF